MIKLTVFVTIFLLMLFSNTSCLRKKEQNEIKTISIVVTSDVHGRFFRHKNSGEGSLSQVSAFVKNLESIENRELIVLDNGDMMQGSLANIFINNFFSEYDRHPAAMMMDYIGYEAASVGNHEIELGEKFYSNLRKDFSFPWLSSNIMNKNSESLYFPSLHIIEIDGLKIAVIGSSVVSSMLSIPSQKRKNLHFEVFEKAMDKALENLKNHAEYDILAGLFHEGAEDSIIEYVENRAVFDVVFLGHDHEILSDIIICENGKKTHMLNPGAYAKNVAVYSFDFDGKVFSNIKSDIFSIENHPRDSHFDETFDIIKKLTEKHENIEIGHVEGNICSGSALFGDSRYMKLIHNVMLKNSDADISLAAPIAFDKDISGKVTNKDVFEIYPFHNYLYVVSMYGYEIKNLLDFSAAKWFDGSEKHFLRIKNSCRKGKNAEIKGSFCLENKFYNFMSASGMEYTVNLKEKSKPDTIIQSVNGKLFFREKKYRVAIDSYHANDGGKVISEGAGINRETFYGRIVSISDTGIRNMIVRYISEKENMKSFYKPNWKVNNKERYLIKEEENIIFRNFSTNSKRRQK